MIGQLSSLKGVNVYMRLINPELVRQLFAEKKKWMTVEQIADGLGVSTKTIGNALSGKSLRPATAVKLAAPLGLDATDIATFLSAPS